MNDEDLELLMVGVSALVRCMHDILPVVDDTDQQRKQSLEQVSHRLLNRAHELGGRETYGGADEELPH